MCRFKHPEPLIPRIPGFSTQASVSQQAQPTSPVQPIPPGTVQVHGTTYFPVAQEGSAPQPPLPSTGPQRSPQFPLHYSPTAASVPSGYSPYSNASLSFRSPVYESRQVVPMVSVASTSSEDANRYAGMRPPIPSGDVKVDDTPTKDATGLDEFPYRPPVHQRSGHARRVSVTLKSKEDSDALGLTNHGTTRRQSWMTHSKRDAETHRVSCSRSTFISESFFFLTSFLFQNLELALGSGCNGIAFDCVLTQVGLRFLKNVSSTFSLVLLHTSCFLVSLTSV